MPLFRSFLTVMLATAFYSCDPCRNLDCVSDRYEGQFRITSATTGTDLLFGPNRVYDRNQVRFYALKGTDTTYFTQQAVRFGGTAYDSILQVRFYPQTDVAYLRLSNGDIDTLAISYKTTPTRCCGTITEITRFRYNNAVDLPGDGGTLELKK